MGDKGKIINKKSRTCSARDEQNGCKDLLVRFLCKREDRNERTVFHFLLEFDDAVDEGEEGMILAHSDVQSGVVYRSALAEDDVAGFCELAAIDLDAQTFAVGFASVA